MLLLKMPSWNHSYKNVILSKESDSRSESLSQSKDRVFACATCAQEGFSATNHFLNALPAISFR
jgi:hypothetical protein